MNTAIAELDAVCAVKDATANLVQFYDKLDRVAPTMVVSRPSEQFWLAGRLVMGAESSPPLFLGSMKSIYADHLPRAFLDAVLAEDWEGASDSMLEAVRLTSKVFPSHAVGHHEVAANKAVASLFGMKTARRL